MKQFAMIMIIGAVLEKEKDLADYSLKCLIGEKILLKPIGRQ